MHHRLLILAVWLAPAVVLLWTAPAQAYPWMIQHEYTGCGVCHTDPSGGYLLTAYGRAQTQTLLSTWGHGPPGDEVDSRSQFAWGVSLPEALDLGVAVRNLYLVSKPSGAPARTRFVQMQADARARVTVGSFEAAGSLGFVHEGAYAAAVTRWETNNVVSREFWLGARLGEDQATVLRGGRLSLPFGIRTENHILYARSRTRTDLDTHQQWGVSVFHQTESFRAEIMGIAGNYQISPDDYRERGYSGYFELVLAPRAALGVSSLVTSAALDPEVAVSAVRGAHGPFVRWGPTADLAVLAEVDVVHRTPEQVSTELGLVSLAGLDWELTRGVHGLLTFELETPRFQEALWSHRQWLSAVWFLYPHIDLRLDAFLSHDQYGPQSVDAVNALGQVHVSL